MEQQNQQNQQNIDMPKMKFGGQGSKIEELEQTIKKQESNIEELKQSIKKLNSKIEDLEQSIRIQKQKIDQLKQDIEEKEQKQDTWGLWLCYLNLNSTCTIVTLGKIYVWDLTFGILLIIRSPCMS